MPTETLARPDRRIRRREIAIALAVLTPLWTLGVALRSEVTVLAVSTLAAVVMDLPVTTMIVQDDDRGNHGT